MTTMTNYPVVAELVYNTFKASGLEIDDNCRIKGQDKWASFCEMMDYEGFKFLGAGFFSAVFKHDDYAGKVFKFGFKVEDSGAAYAAWCRAEWQAGRGVACIPKVHHIERNSEFYMVVLDELQSVAQVYPDLVDEDDCVSWINGDLSMIGSMERALYGQYENFMDYVDDIESYELADQKLAQALKSSELYLMLNRLGGYFEGVATFDLHSENFMFNQNGEIVITDPVSFTH